RGLVWRWGWRLFWVGVWLGLGVGVVYWLWSGTFHLDQVREMPQRSAVYDRDGKFYSKLQGENRVVVPLSRVSRHFVDALIAREDSRFYSHCGLDPIGIARAVVRNVIRRGAAQGASTLTQQLARNSFPERVGQRKSLHRKLLEACLALRIEQRFSKDEILESYLNRIYFGSGVYGLEGASQVYFGKPAAGLSLGEAATIAGIIRSPSRFSPLNNPKGARRERDTVLERMVTVGKITRNQADEVRQTGLVVRKGVWGAQENYAMDAVRRELDWILSEERRGDGGLKVYTTLDPLLQQAAEKAVDAELKKVEARPGYGHPKRSGFTAQAKREELDTPYLQGAVVVLENGTGGVRAVVGGRDFSESKYNRAILPQAARQVGSTFKPFVYAAAYGRGVFPGRWVQDAPLGRSEIPGAAGWNPQNSDGTYRGAVPAEEGLVESRNTVSVRVGNMAGIESVAKLGESVGFRKVPRKPVAYLGALEGTALEVAGAYGALANGGVYRKPYLIERVEDESGEVIYKQRASERRVMDPGVAWMVTSGLRQVLQRGTAASAKELGFDRVAAGKTGTTNDYRDAWFAGYTSSLTCAVWVGLDRPQTIISKGYGATLALPIWVNILNAAPQKRYPTADFPAPGGEREVALCRHGGGRATEACEKAGTSYTARVPSAGLASKPCPVHGGRVLEEKRSGGENGRGFSSLLKSFFGSEPAGRR
ncbi:MAG: hypothetical protein RLZZ253_2155, partial [Verrucomicrobiota bacterium]